MDVIAVPFRLTADGSLAKVVQGSDAHLAQQAVNYVSTRPGQLPLAPSYGLNDPTFRVVDEGEIRSGMSRFHPDVVLDEISIGYDIGGKVSYINAEISNAGITPTTYDSEVIFGA